MTSRFFILTIPYNAFNPTDFNYKKYSIVCLEGQAERAASGYEHWQLCVAFKTPVRISGVKKAFGASCHAEKTRSESARAYCHKEETRIAGSTVKLGDWPMRRNVAKDWDLIREQAKSGDLEEVPSDIFVRNYRTLKAIEKDYMKPAAVEKEVFVFWGATGTGKSRRAWEEATFDAYPKDPNTKFWDGYQGQQNVVIDEFRGKIDISHMLRWLDRYPVCVEQKFGASVFKATKIWITSNVSPRDWYPDLDEESKCALLRRLKITHFNASL